MQGRRRLIVIGLAVLKVLADGTSEVVATPIMAYPNPDAFSGAISADRLASPAGLGEVTEES